METQTAKAFKNLDTGNENAAFSIFKTFKAGITPDEKRAIEIHNEVLKGRASYYQSIKVDIAAAKALAYSAINKLRPKTKQQAIC